MQPKNPKFSKLHPLINLISRIFKSNAAPAPKVRDSRRKSPQTFPISGVRLFAYRLSDIGELTFKTFQQAKPDTPPQR